MRRTRACLLIAAVLMTGAISAVSSPATAAPAARADGPQLRVGSYNFEETKPLKLFTTAITRLRSDVDVAGLQEIGIPARTQWLLRDHSWGYYRPPALQQNPVIWRRDTFDFVSAKGIKIADKQNLGNEHGGGAEAKDPTYATVVHLLDRANGQQISLMNVHLVHGGVKRTDPWPGRPRTYRLYVAQVRGLVKAVKAERANTANDGGVFVTGDFNISYKPDFQDKKPQLPYASMLRIGMHSMWQGSPQMSKNQGTHGTSLYDQVWHPQAPTATKILTDIKGSDHYPAMATYTLPPPYGYVPVTGAVGFVQRPVTGSEFYKHSFLTFPLTGDLNTGWVEVRQVPEDGNDVAKMGSDFTVEDQSLQPGSSGIVVRALADGDTHEQRLEHFTLQLVAHGDITLTPGEDTVQGYIDDSDKK